MLKSLSGMFWRRGSSVVKLFEMVMERKEIRQAGRDRWQLYQAYLEKAW